MSITIGWWALPALITAAAFYFALREQPAPSGHDIGLMFVMAAAILSLVAWLVWAVFA